MAEWLAPRKNEFQTLMVNKDVGQQTALFNGYNCDCRRTDELSPSGQHVARPLAPISPSLGVLGERTEVPKENFPLNFLALVRQVCCLISACLALP